MAMNPWGVNLDALQMMSNPLLRGFASQQQEEEEPVGFWNKIASRMPGYNLPSMQNDMKRQALNEALIMAGASMMQNAGSGNIGSAIAEALTKGMGTYKEGVSSQYQGLQEQRKREMEDLENAREAERLGISKEQLAIMKKGEERASTEFERETEEWEANAGIRSGRREVEQEKLDREKGASSYNMGEVIGTLGPEERRLVEAERELNGASAAQALAIDFYNSKRKRETEERRIAAYGAQMGRGGDPKIPTSIWNKLHTSAQSALKELDEKLKNVPYNVAGNNTKEAAWRNATTDGVLKKYGWESLEELNGFISTYKAQGAGLGGEDPGAAFEEKKKALEELLPIARSLGPDGLRARGVDESDIDVVMKIIRMERTGPTNAIVR